MKVCNRLLIEGKALEPVFVFQGLWFVMMKLAYKGALIPTLANDFVAEARVCELRILTGQPKS